MDPTQWSAPYPVVVAALFVIVLLRSNATYWLGRLVAAGAERTRARRLMATPGYLVATERVNRWGAPAVSASFLTIGVQTLVNLAAGAIRMPLVRYLPATVVGSLMWAFLYATVGLVGLDGLQLLWTVSPRATAAFGILAVGGLVWFIVRQYRRRSTAEPERSVSRRP